MAASVVLIAAAAQAQPARSLDERARARVLADEGANAFARADYARAELLLEHAYSIVPAPTVALLRARALVRLKRWIEAERAYRAAASTKLDSTSGEAFQRASEQAKTELLLLLPRMPRLRIDVAEPLLHERSLRVSVDGRAISSAELAGWLTLDPTEHLVLVEVDGRKLRSMTVTLAERDRIALAVEAPKKRPDAARTWGIIGLTAGGAALGFGVVTGVVAMNAHADAKRDCPGGVCASSGSGADAVDRFETYRTLSTIGYVAGAAGIGIGTYVLVTSPRSETPVTLSTSLEGVRVRGAW